MQYRGLIFGSVVGRKSGNLLFISKGKTFEAEDGDVDADVAEPLGEVRQVAVMEDGTEVETAAFEPRKRGRKAK